MKCTTDWEKMYKVCLKESERIEQELATLKASLPKIKADAVFECAPMPKWGGQPDDIPADFDGYCQAIHEVHENANKLEAGE